MIRILVTTFFLLFSFLSFPQDALEVLNKYLAQSGGGDSILESITSSYEKELQIGHIGEKDTIITETFIKNQYLLIRSFRGKRKTPSNETHSDGNKTLIRFYDPFPMEKTFEASHVDYSIPHELYNALRQKRVKKAKDIVLKGRECVSVVVKRKGRNNGNIRYYFDKGSARLVASSTEAVENNFTYYSDFVVQSGIELPMASEYHLNDQLITSERTLARSFNTIVSDSLFIPKKNGTPQRVTDSRFNKVTFVTENTNVDLEQFLSYFKGKRILIDIWATWCAPCKYEFGRYDDDFYAFLEKNKIEMVFLSTDKPEIEQKWKEDVAFFNINGYHAIAGPRLKQSIAEKIYNGETAYIPRYALVNEQGEILNAKVAKPSSKDFKGQIEAAFKK